MGEAEKRRDRKKRSGEEIRCLIKLACDMKHIIENKKTDSTTSQEKNKAWLKITEYFNAASGFCYRTTETLKNRYEGMKKALKKKVIHNKKESQKTGGGPPDYIKLEDFEISLLEIIQTQVNGLTSYLDSDCDLPKTTISGELLSDKSINDIENALENTVDHSNEELLCEFVVEDGGISENIIDEIEQNTFSEHDNTYKRVTNESSKQWNSWTPTALKTKKNPVLKTPKRVKAAHCDKLNFILEQRHDLVKLQIEHIKNEAERAIEKHKKDMELLDLKIEIKKKKLHN